MPQLQIVQDPYAGETSSAVNSMASGFMPDPKGAAEAQELAARIRQSNMQQQELQMKMRMAEEDRKKQQVAEDAAGRYFGYATPAPVANLGQAPSRDDMEKYYREQNYRDQAARAAIRSGKGTEDIAKGMSDYETNFRTAHPAQGAGVPQYPAGVAGNPVAQKKFDEERGKGAAEQMVADEASRVAAAKYLPEMLRARQHYSDASGYIGQFEGNEWTQGPQNIVGKLPYAGGVSQGVEKRAALQKEMAAFQGPQIAANNKGLGPMTNYEQGLARLPFAKVDDVNAKVGLDAFDGQLAHTLKAMGYSVPPAHITMLLDGVKNRDPQVLKDFQEHYGPEAFNTIMGALQ